MNQRRFTHDLIENDEREHPIALHEELDRIWDWAGNDLTVRREVARQERHARENTAPFHPHVSNVSPIRKAA